MVRIFGESSYAQNLSGFGGPAPVFKLKQPGPLTTLTKAIIDRNTPPVENSSPTENRFKKVLDRLKQAPRVSLTDNPGPGDSRRAETLARETGQTIVRQADVAVKGQSNLTSQDVLQLTDLEKAV